MKQTYVPNHPSSIHARDAVTNDFAHAYLLGKFLNCKFDVAKLTLSVCSLSSVRSAAELFVTSASVQLLSVITARLCDGIVHRQLPIIR